MNTQVLDVTCSIVYVGCGDEQITTEDPQISKMFLGDQSLVHLVNSESARADDLLIPRLKVTFRQNQKTQMSRFYVRQFLWGTLPWSITSVETEYLHDAEAFFNSEQRVLTRSRINMHHQGETLTFPFWGSNFWYIHHVAGTLAIR